MLSLLQAYTEIELIASKPDCVDLHNVSAEFEPHRKTK